MRKVSIILFNLGGPSSLKEVKPFLFNLFYDKAILPMMNPFRWILAKIISEFRSKKSIQIYKLLGGGSPILAQTETQARSLLEKFSNSFDVQVLISMRYSSPRSFEIIEQIENHNPEDIILLPLYPHFSVTTTNSSIEDFITILPKSLKNTKKRIICCYPTEKSFIKAHQNLLRSFLEKNKNVSNLRLLISAHSLPKAMIDKGDPYEWQVKATSYEIMKDFPEIEWKISYQSKVGPVEWLEPSTENAIKEAALEGKNVLILPISFVSENSETLVELDIEYKNLAKTLGIEIFDRLPTLQIAKDFVSSLYDLCEDVLSKNQINSVEIYSRKEYRICPEAYCKCINKRNAN